MRTLTLLLTTALIGCRPAAPSPTTALPLDTSDVVVTITGLEGPEAVRYDPDQRVWFVANFGASAGEDPRDANGFITRVSENGEVLARRFMTGTAAAPLHMPRGMFITGDTLWVADVDGVHGFDRRTGRHLAFLDFTALEPGFLNDIAAAPDGVLHVTDTGRSRVYRVSDGRAVAATDSLVSSPNGIAWDAGRRVFLLAPWQGPSVIRSLTPAGVLDSVAALPAGRADGIEPTIAGILVATQTDSSLWLLRDGVPVRVARTRGRPADIGWDAARQRVAVPYIALDRVDVWALP